MARKRRDSAVLREFHRDRAYAQQREYAAMSEPEQRAYAAAHPAFVSRFGNVIPESVRWAMADAPTHEAEDAIYDRYRRSVTRQETVRYLAARHISFGERLIYVILAAALFVILGGALAAVAYVAAGAHGAVTAGAATLAVFSLYAGWRMLSSQRDG